MHMLQSGVHFNDIALYFGHETPTTTHRYVEANLAMKEQALARLKEPPTVVPRYRPPDELRQFLEDLSLCEEPTGSKAGQLWGRHRNFT